MLVQFEKIDELSVGIVDFYTIRLGDNELTEFERFDEKNFPEHAEELEKMYNVINLISHKGAKKFYFKEEHAAHALPIVSNEIKDANKNDFGIRLYCIYLHSRLVVLLNGDIKTEQNPKNCPHVREHFLRAIKLAQLIDKAIAEQEINIQSDFPFSDIELEL